MKRTCNGCRALENNRGYFHCDLGYKVEQKTVEKVINVGAKPKEECPKPTTYDNYLKLKGY
ncbi:MULTISPECIES: hypothetical protein [Lysinibacillus]|uniref:hypothetical protein n=1 Tax=Lysinibacillus TaxID=400634 RepID=UPI00214C58FD|nr:MULTISPECIES: hypothetical protein [Lysinibacillus]UUV26084.1 hypothetical protein NP781_05565 [Lysinibacillus sp. FN11]UYB48957.1 hypothetical protein OCI51_08345 [Lysinibacillus capsici]